MAVVKKFNYDQGYKDVDGVRYAGLTYIDNVDWVYFFDLTLNPRTFNVQYDKDIYGGGFVAKGSKGSDKQIIIKNCHFKGDITVKCTGDAMVCAGGFAGIVQSDLYVSDCVVEKGSVTALSVDDLAYAGGILGFCDPDENEGVWDFIEDGFCETDLQITRCRNKADILAEGDDDSGTTVFSTWYDGISAGGMIGCHDSDGYYIVGRDTYYHPSVENSLNKGVITAWSEDSGSRAAGMIGACHNKETMFLKCVNVGSLVANGGKKLHISGTYGSYDENASLKCRWNNNNNYYGVYDKSDTGGYTEVIDASLMNGGSDGYSSWSGTNGSLDLNF